MKAQTGGKIYLALVRPLGWQYNKHTIVQHIIYIIYELSSLYAKTYKREQTTLKKRPIKTKTAMLLFISLIGICQNVPH